MRKSLVFTNAKIIDKVIDLSNIGLNNNNDELFLSELSKKMLNRRNMKDEREEISLYELGLS